MNAADCQSRLNEIKRRRDQGVALFPDDYEFLLFLAGYGCCWLSAEEAEQREKHAAFNRIGVR